MTTRRPDEDGFTLIEMIVSLAILSIALGVLFAAFSQDMTQQRRIKVETAARLEAEALLARNLVDPATAPGRTAGETADGLRWTLTVSPYGSAEDRKAWAFAPAQVTARVDWAIDGRAHAVSLSTLRIMAPPAEDTP
jgi:type II secretion system protein I